MLLKYLHEEIHNDKTQYGGDLDLFNRECARYFAVNGNPQYPENRP